MVGCGALKRLDPNHLEVKSIRSSPARVRNGIASLLLEHVITEARRMGFHRMSLETGTADFFFPTAAVREVRLRLLRTLRRLPPGPHNTFMAVAS